MLQLSLLTNPRSDDAQEQQDNGDVRLWHCVRGHIVKKQSVVGPVDRGAIGQEGLVAASSQWKSMFFPLADYFFKLRRRGVDEGHQQAEIHGTSRSEHRAHTQQQAAQMEAAWDDACAHQAIRLPQPGEHHRAHQPCDSWHTHQQTEERAAYALCVGIARGDAVKAQDRGVEEGQTHPCQEDGLAIVGLPTIFTGAHQPAEPPETQRQVGDFFEMQARVAVNFC